MKTFTIIKCISITKQGDGIIGRTTEGGGEIQLNPDYIISIIPVPYPAYPEGTLLIKMLLGDEFIVKGE